MAAEDVESTIHRISDYQGVLGCIVVSPTGEIMKTTCQPAAAEQHAKLIPQLAAMAQNATRELDPQDELQMLRIRSKAHEILVAPSEEFVMIVVQSAATEAA